MRERFAILTAAALLGGLLGVVPATASANGATLFTGETLSATWEGPVGDRWYRLHLFARDGLFCDPDSENCKKKNAGSPDQLVTVDYLEVYGVDPETGEANGTWYGSLWGQQLASQAAPGTLQFDAQSGRLKADHIVLEGIDAAGMTIAGGFSIDGTFDESCGRGRDRRCELSFTGTYPSTTGWVDLSSEAFAGFDLSGGFFTERQYPLGL